MPEGDKTRMCGARAGKLATNKVSDPKCDSPGWERGGNMRILVGNMRVLIGKYEKTCWKLWGNLLENVESTSKCNLHSFLIL